MQSLLHFAQDSDTSGYFPQLAKWHDRSQYKMTFGTLKPMAPWLREYMQNQGVECYSCECQTRRQYPVGLWKLIRYLSRENFQIIHTHLFDPSVIGLTAGLIAGTPLRVMTRHYSTLHTRINKHWHVKIDRSCNRLAHSIIGVSKHTSEHVINVEHTSPSKVTTILNGIDFDRVRLSSDTAPNKVRNEYISDSSELLILAVGRLSPEKGYEYLLEALPHLSRTIKYGVKLLIAGAGPGLEQYRKVVGSIGWADRIHFLGHRNDIADLMAAADLMVLPSLSEAFGLVLAEALYLGTPVVATNIGGIPEIISDGVDGILVSPTDPKALAAGMARLINDGELRSQMTGAGRAKVEKHFRFETMVRSYENVYQRMIQAKQRRANNA